MEKAWDHLLLITYHCLLKILYHFSAENLPIEPEDCVWGHWSTWSSCSKLCGVYSVQSRNFAQFVQFCLQITESSYKHFHQGNTYQSSSFQIKLYFLLEQRCAKVPPWMMSSFESSKTIQRIVGGDDALSPIPWQVQVHVAFLSFGFFCRGTILDKTAVIWMLLHCCVSIGPFL